MLPALSSVVFFGDILVAEMLCTISLTLFLHKSTGTRFRWDCMGICLRYFRIFEDPNKFSNTSRSGLENQISFGLSVGFVVFGDLFMVAVNVRKRQMRIYRDLNKSFEFESK